MSTLCDAQVSVFRGATDAHPSRTTTIGAILDDIQTSAYRAAIERLRHLRLATGQLVQHSGVAHGDLDHLKDLQATKQALCTDPHTAYCFVSPGGDGLKVGVCIAPVTDDATYKHAWQTVAHYFQVQYGVTWAPSSKDVCRLCFVSWDPALYSNPDAQMFPVPPASTSVPHLYPPPPPRRPVPHSCRDWYARQALDRATHLIAVSVPGQQHYAQCKAAYLLGGYIAGGLLSYEDASTALEAAVQRTAQDVPRAMRDITDGLAAGQHAPITAEDVAQERQVWRATHWRTCARTWTGHLRTVGAEEIPPWH
jgi:hypothetical protein